MHFTELLWGILPALLWLLYFYSQDRLPEPPKLVLKTFLFGAISVIPAALIEKSFVGGLGPQSPLSTIFLLSFGVIATAEEFSKLAAISLGVGKTGAIDSGVDGIVYGVSAGLGFSMLENILYINSFGLNVAPIRAIFSNLAHALFTGLMGYYYAHSIMWNRVSEMWKGLFWAIFLHGLYDFILISGLINPFWSIVLLGVTFEIIRRVFKRQRI